MTTIERMTTAELVAEYNRLNPDKPVKRFSDRATAIKRVYAALGQQPSGFPPAPQAESTTGTPAEPSAAPQAAPAPGAVQDTAAKPVVISRRTGRPKVEGRGKRPPTTSFKASGKKQTEPKPKSKRAVLLSLLQRPEGITMEAAIRKFEWKPQDFKDCLRLLATKHGVASKLGDDGKWRVA